MGQDIFEPIYKKYKSVFLYIFFGGCTTIVSVLSFYVMDEIFRVNEHIANLISWIVAVLFAFITNSKWVFENKTNGKIHFFKQMLAFYAGRFTTFLVEELMLFTLVTIAGLNSLLIKIIAQFVVLVLNFIISKFFIFKKNQK